MMDVLSLDASERTAPDHKAADAIDRVTDKVALHQALTQLDPREQLVIRSIFGLGGETPMDVYDVSNTHLIPRSTVYALQKSGLRKLRSLLAS